MVPASRRYFLFVLHGFQVPFPATAYGNRRTEKFMMSLCEMAQGRRSEIAPFLFIVCEMHQFVDRGDKLKPLSGINLIIKIMLITTIKLIYHYYYCVRLI